VKDLTTENHYLLVPKNGFEHKRSLCIYDEIQPKDNEKYSWNGISLFNDLWNISTELYPELNTIKQNLEERYKKNFFMSGSGSALFSLFEEHEEIEEIDSEEFNLKYFSITKKIDCSFSQNDD
jgi:4-diphosphocytidyl-2C-methyl-D-erythritol 2-phosphate synthase